MKTISSLPHIAPSGKGRTLGIDNAFEARSINYIRRKAPDVARMGDLDLENDTDSEYVQQIKIKEVIPHPLYTSHYRYNDIALLKLSQSIK